MAEFDYKQRKTTDSYRKGWEKAFSSKDDLSEYDEEFEFFEKLRPDMEETTDQKQP